MKLYKEAASENLRNYKPCSSPSEQQTSISYMQKYLGSERKHLIRDCQDDKNRAIKSLYSPEAIVHRRILLGAQERQKLDLATSVRTIQVSPP